jgi:hypothetical protein
MKELNPFVAPNPNLAPSGYAPQYHNQINSQNRLYFVQLDNVNREVIPAVHSLNVLHWLGPP